MNEDIRKYYIKAADDHKSLLAEKLDIEGKLRASGILLSKLEDSLTILDILTIRNSESDEESK